MGEIKMIFGLLLEVFEGICFIGMEYDGSV